jgi:hypothetical protein
VVNVRDVARPIARAYSSLVRWDPFRRSGDEWLRTRPLKEQREEWERRFEEDLQSLDTPPGRVRRWQRRRLEGLRRHGYPPPPEGGGS